MHVGTHSEPFGGDGARFTALRAHRINSSGMTGFVAFKNDALRIVRELASERNNLARRDRTLLANPGRKKHEIRRRKILPQNQYPLTVRRQRISRPLAQPDGRSAIGRARKHSVITAAGLPRLDEQ